MPWISERLTGTIDGSNRFFRISNTPVTASVLIIYRGVAMEAVSSQPDTMELAFTQNGTLVELGIAPLAGQQPWIRYWYDPSAPIVTDAFYGGGPYGEGIYGS